MIPAIPDHTLLCPIGRGAYGEVWLARNVMGAPRAVKLIWRQQFDSDRPYEREFAGIQRYEPVSRMTDGLVQVLHVGRNETEGYFYYVMELADDVHGPRSMGKDLESGGLPPLSKSSSYQPRMLRSDLKRLGRLPVMDCLQIALDVVSGLARLHQHGLVHRDVKPGNIIFVNGRAKLADIGLVSIGGEGRTFVGTEGYIPPEGPGTVLADIYALGMCLYEAVTGYSPDRFPKVPPQWFAQDADTQPLEFQEIVLKACEGAKEKRYQTAEQMQADLALLQSGQSVRRMRALERRVARFRLLGAAALAAVLLAVGAVLAANYRAGLEAQSRAKELALRQRAEAAEHEAQRQLFAALLREAHATVQSRELGQRVLALDAVRRAAQITNTIELQREALAALALPDLRFERELATGPDCTMVSLDPKFERMAIGRGTNAVEIRSVTDQRLLATLPASTPEVARFARWSPCGQFLGICRRISPTIGTKDLEIWDTVTGQRRLFVPETPWNAFSFHPTKARVLCPTAENSVVLFDLESGQELKTFSVTGGVHHLEFSPDGQTFIAQHRPGGIEYRAGVDWYTSVYHVETGALLSSVVSGWIDGMAWHPKDRWIAFAARTGEVHLHDRKSGTRRVLGRHKNEARTAAFSPDGDFLFTGGEEQEIICWDLRSMQRAFTVSLQSPWLQFCADAERCAVPTRTGVLLHRFERSLPCREMRGDLGSGVKRGAISPDGRWLAAAGTDRMALWDLSRDAPAAMATNLFNPPTPVFSPDSSELLVFWREGILRWAIGCGADASAAPEVTSLPIYYPGPLLSLGFSRDTLVLGTGQGAVVVPPAAIASGPGKLFNLGAAQGRISPNGLWAAFPKWNPPRELVCQLNPWLDIEFVSLDSDTLAEAFTPSSDELAVATHTSVTFIDTNRWAPQRRFPVTLDRNAEIIFTPEGTAFWLVHDARTAVLHDTRTFARLLLLPAGTIPLAVSPDGKHLVVSIDARRVQVWDMPELRTQLRDLGMERQN